MFQCWNINVDISILDTLETQFVAKEMQMIIFTNHNFDDPSVNVTQFIIILTYLAVCDINEGTKIYVSRYASLLILKNLNATYVYHKLLTVGQKKFSLK